MTLLTLDKNFKKYFYIIFVLIIIFFSLWLLNIRYAFFVNEKDMVISDFVEVNDYQGENFSDFSDFREKSINGVQNINIKDYRLKIGGLVEEPIDLVYSMIIQTYPAHKKVAKLNCVEGWSVNILWEGFLVSDILKSVCVKDGAKTVIFKAADGYSTSFPLNYIMNNNIIMAYKMNDQVIPAERGFPFQLVAESKWGYKWIKWITAIELSADENYQGFWESRGYSDSGDLDKPKLK